MDPFSQAMVQSQVPPWHLWGNFQRFQLVSGSMGVVENQQNQLLRVAYKRPETWHWLLGATLVSVDPIPSGIQQAGVFVTFQVTAGLGRASLIMPVFERFHWRFDLPGTNPLNSPELRTVYSTSAFAPNRDFDTVGTPTVRDNRIDELVAQDVQVEAVVSGDSNYVNTMVVEVYGFFAPKNHLRPDWFNVEAPLHAQFPGGEVGGS